MTDMPSKTPNATRRMAARARALRRRYPALSSPQKGEAVRHLASLLMVRDILTEQMLEGKHTTSQPALRALADSNRAIIDMFARLGLVPAAPKAGTEPDDDEADDEPELEEQYESNLQRRHRLLQDEEEPAPRSRRAGKQKAR